MSLWSPKQDTRLDLEIFETHRFERSGWPVALELLGLEAWRRYETQELTHEEFYCSDAHRQGMFQAGLAGQPASASERHGG